MAYWVNNVGSLAGTLSADLKTTENAENGCNDAERSADNTCADWTSGGEFSQFATVEFLRPAVTTEAACSNETTGTSIAPAVKIDTAVAAPAVPVFDIPGGQGACVVVNVTLPPTAGNIVQSDSTTLSADLTLTQK